MSAESSNNVTEGEGSMTQHNRGRGWRLLSLGLATGLLFVLAGDPGRALTYPISGTDPLEVLDLKIKPNVIVLLDSSGSMRGRLAGGNVSGDHPRSKLYQAKSVLNDIVALNENKVSFMFGTYTQAGSRLSNRTAGDDRFMYYTRSDLWPSMLTDEITIERALGDVTDAGLRSWQLMYEDWNTLWFEEDSGATCRATLPGPFPKFYARGGSGSSPATSTTPQNLSFDLQTAMNSATCTGGSRQNTYAVSYTSGQFVFAATGPSQFRLLDRAQVATNNISEALNSFVGGGSTFTARDLDRRSGYTEVDSNGAHGVSVGDVCVVTNADQSIFNGTWTVTQILDWDTFRMDGPVGSDLDGDSANLVCTGPARSGNGHMLLYRAGSGSSGWITFEFTENVDGSPVTFYQARAGRLWNGETLRVQEDGTICGMDFGDASTRTNPPSFTVQQVGTGCGSDLTGQSAVFEYAGGQFTGNSQICYGFQAKVGVVPCDLAASQIATIGPHIDLELPFNADGTAQNYTERMDGSWAVDTYPLDTQGGAKADGFTPIRNSLLDLKVEFQKLWDTGPLPTDPGYNPAWDSVTPPGQKAIKNHVNPKEKTIVLLITDGDDTCGADRISSGGGADNNARLAAYAAEDLYRRLDINEPTSSVETFVIGFAGGTPNRLNWIAWGGSGLTRGSETAWTSASSTTLADARDLCTTCQDALIAPDAATLERQIQAIIDQGATIGTFSASRQSITDSVYEYVYLANDATNTFSPTDPDSRYQALAPTRFVSNFELPGFRGELTAWQDRNANGILEDPTDVAWRAGEKLLARVRSAFIGCAAGDDLCTFSEINGRIDRRIYTTEGNGVFYDSSNPVSLAGFGAGTTPQAARESLWPLADPMAEPFTGFDAAAGIPTDLTTLQSVFGACVREASAVLPTGCISNPLQEATREARQIILAYMAGADRVIAGTLGEPMRDATGNILYRPRAWMLAETTQATAAVLGPPLSSEPEVFSAEFRIFRDGRNSAGDPLSSGMVDRGCGLRDPADDNAIQPVMTQVFLPANDMLHAFRAGPCAGACSSDTGGEELWGFVPYDLLPSLRDRFIEQPQGRENHVYMLARGIRYADVFFPVDTTDSAWCGSGDGTTLNGIWRRVLFLPRGAGGKYMTALDVTSPGDLTTPSAYARGPVPLWSRGNPDQAEATQERAGSTDNHDRGDTADYAHMGETWSLPVVALVDSTNTYYNRSPRDNQRAVTHALFMGSGYGDTSGCPSDPCEGQTFYTLDALTGDIIATADVGERAELVPTGPDDELRWENALVANAAGFNPRAYSLLETVHPSASKVTRVYIADLHGRLWKFLTAEPDVAIQMADLSITVNPGDPAGPAAQPVATAAGLIGLPPYQGDVNLVEPHVFVTSGYDRRASEGPFKIFGFRDTGGPLDTQLGTAVDNPDQNDPNAPGYCPTPCNVRTYAGNAGSELLFARPFDEGVAVGGCTNPIPGNVFRGTVQPATSFEPCDPTSPTCTLAVGRVFFGGTRLNLPATEFAPPTPLACSTGDYPCRSSFDSILYALGAATGMAAYDINLDPTADDAYRIYRDQRITAVTMAADPAQSGGARVLIDEGQVGGATPIAPPPAGVPPSVTTAGTGIVVMSRDANFPPAAVRVGSSVCQ